MQLEEKRMNKKYEQYIYVHCKLPINTILKSARAIISIVLIYTMLCDAMLYRINNNA